MVTRPKDDGIRSIQCLPEGACHASSGLGIGVLRLAEERNEIDGASWKRHIS
jgi:hypothetical protein